MQNTTPKTYDYPQFTEEMRRDYTILVPNMLPVQLGLICRLMRNYGYKMELQQAGFLFRDHFFFVPVFHDVFSFC